jgi:hypothetical protein
MPRQNCQRKPGTTRGSPRWAHTARTSRISRPAVKSGCAREWDGWGRLSEDGPGQHNPARSEGPWGRAADAARMTVLVRATPPAQNGDSVSASGEYEGGTQTRRRDTWTPHGQAPLDMSALKPYRGKPAVRNFRGDDGDVGIIRSPVRAIALPGSQLVILQLLPRMNWAQLPYGWRRMVFSSQVSHAQGVANSGYANE